MNVERPARFERATPCFVGKCSGPAELRARNLLYMAESRGVEPHPRQENPVFKTGRRPTPLHYFPKVVHWNARLELNQPLSGCNRAPGRLATRI